MKSTLKRESKGLEVVKMEANGFSTDRLAGIKAERVLQQGAGWEGASSGASPPGYRCRPFSWYFAPRLVSMGAPENRKRRWRLQGKLASG